MSSMSYYETMYRKQGYSTIAGIDEAGRGPLAGPVVASACILQKNFFLKDLNDSKKLTPKKRQEIYQTLISSDQVTYSVATVDVFEIDRINILQATFLAMKKAVSELKVKPDILFVDGNMTPFKRSISKCIIKGDTLSMSIAAASVIAKETRDGIMKKYHEKWPFYGFLDHKGYGTKKHLEAIHKFGICDIHRKSFEPIKSMFK